MFHGIRTRLVLGTAALALLVGGIATPIAPAFATPLTPAPEREYLVSKPDLRAQFVSKQFLEQHFTGKQQYPPRKYTRNAYTVKNIGQDPTGVVMLKGECFSLLNQEFSVPFAKIIPPLAAGESTPVSFDCDDGWGSRLTVGTQGDINPSNNIASNNWP